MSSDSRALGISANGAPVFRTGIGFSNSSPFAHNLLLSRPSEMQISKGGFQSIGTVEVDPRSGIRWDRFSSWKSDRSVFLSIMQREAASAVAAAGLWERGSVVHHVHSLDAGGRLPPDRHRGAVGERLVRTPLIVESDPLGDTVRGVPAVA